MGTAESEAVSKEPRTMLIQVFDRDMPTIPVSSGEERERYVHYVTSFAMVDPTENVPEIVSWPVLKPVDANESGDRPTWSSVISDDRIGLAIDSSTYKIKLAPGGVDILAHARSDDVSEDTATAARDKLVEEGPAKLAILVEDEVVVPEGDASAGVDDMNVDAE